MYSRPLIHTAWSWAPPNITHTAMIISVVFYPPSSGWKLVLHFTTFACTDLGTPMRESAAINIDCRCKVNAMLYCASGAIFKVLQHLPYRGLLLQACTYKFELPPVRCKLCKSGSRRNKRSWQYTLLQTAANIEKQQKTSLPVSFRNIATGLHFRA